MMDARIRPLRDSETVSGAFRARETVIMATPA
jgi:hypothetical protein